MASYFANNQFFEQFITDVSQNWGISVNIVVLILVLAAVWSAVWKLLGLWKSARKGSIIWFIVLALTNTFGILPILYIYLFSKIKWGKFIKVKVKKAKPSRKVKSKKKRAKKR